MSIKKVLMGCGITVLAVVVGFVLLVAGFIWYAKEDERIAKDPERICDCTDWDLPDYHIVRHYDNMDRGSSAWSEYSYDVTLDEPLSDEQLRELDELVEEDAHWTYDKQTRTYTYSSGDDDKEVYIHVSINAATGSVSMSYMWWDFFA